MTKFKFWNEVCKYGAIIGLVMSVAFVIEQSLMLSGWFSTMGLVWILAAVVYIALLYRFAKRRREQYGHEQGFPLSRGLGFILHGGPVVGRELSQVSAASGDQAAIPVGVGALALPLLPGQREQVQRDPPGCVGDPPPGHFPAPAAHDAAHAPGGGADERRDVAVGHHPPRRHLLDGPQHPLHHLVTHRPSRGAQGARRRAVRGRPGRRRCRTGSATR